jgi:hypothetical protein
MYVSYHKQGAQSIMYIQYILYAYIHKFDKTKNQQIFIFLQYLQIEKK